MIALLSLAALAQTCPAGAPFPGADWPVAAASGPAVAALDAYLFPPGLDRADPARAGTRTDAAVIVRRGEVIYERYGADFTAARPHYAWSMSKTFTNALAGIAVGRGLLAEGESVCRYLDGLPPASCAITVRDLLEFSSGLDWRETYEGASPTASSVLAMLYGEGQPGMARFVASHALRDEPGESWMYDSGDTNLLSAAVGAVLRPVSGERFPWVELFDPIGVTSAVWERDGAGDYVGSSYVYATARDMARFGWLLRSDGCWGERRLLPEGWIASSTAVSRAIQAKPLARDPGDVQGRQIWLNRPVPAIGQDARPWPSAPEDAFAALGHWRQSITVIPSEDLVVVRLADDRDGRFRHDELLRLSLAVARGEDPPPAPPVSAAPPAAPPPATGGRDYAAGLLSLASGFAAKEACSCVFVMGRDEDTCRAWVSVSPDVARFKVDVAEREVHARSLGMARRTARYIDAQTGCRLVE